MKANTRKYTDTAQFYVGVMKIYNINTLAVESVWSKADQKDLHWDTAHSHP